MRRSLPVLLLLAACSSTPSEPAAPAPPPPEPTATAAHDLPSTETYEIRFGDELVGYLVDVKPLPDGQTDTRPFKPGTSLIQDKRFEFLGFISPMGITYKFDAQGEAHKVGFGSRNQSIAAFFRRNDLPRILAVATGQPQG
jgi:hypothetical protein